MSTLVIDPVPHPDMTPERIVLRDGGALIDVSARPAAAGCRLREETTEARGVVVLNAGRTPGISNLAAADLLEEHPDADAVENVFSFSATGSAERLGAHSSRGTRGREGWARASLGETLRTLRAAGGTRGRDCKWGRARQPRGR
jgi:hypothetical protein